MKYFLKFILAGLFLSIPAEIVNQIYVHKSLSGFVQTAIVYVVFMVILFFLKNLFSRIFKNKFSNSLLWYIFLGLFGLLLVEWTLLGNRMAAIYGQIAMFTFWGSFILMPIIFTEDQTPPVLKKSIIKFSFFWIPIYLIAGIPNPGLGLIIWIFGTIYLNYFYFKFFYFLKNNQNPMRSNTLPS